MDKEPGSFIHWMLIFIDAQRANREASGIDRSSYQVINLIELGAARRASSSGNLGKVDCFISCCLI